MTLPDTANGGEMCYLFDMFPGTADPARSGDLPARAGASGLTIDICFVNLFEITSLKATNITSLPFHRALPRQYKS